MFLANGAKLLGASPAVLVFFVVVLLAVVLLVGFDAVVADTAELDALVVPVDFVEVISIVIVATNRSHLD